jgi:hypothetical protein
MKTKSSLGLKTNKPRTALAVLGSRLIGAKGNLSEALAAAHKMLLSLSTPSIWDYMVPPPGLPLPPMPFFAPSPVPSIVTVPLGVLQGTDEIQGSSFTGQWVETHLEQIARLERAGSLRDLYGKCVVTSPSPGSAEPDQSGSNRGWTPLPSSSPARQLCASEHALSPSPRASLRRIPVAGGMLSESKQHAILTLLSSNSRWLFWLSRITGWRDEIRDRIPSRIDLYSGLTRLPTSKGRAWLQNLLAAAGTGAPEAASPALPVVGNNSILPENSRLLPDFLESSEACLVG